MNKKFIPLIPFVFFIVLISFSTVNAYTWNPTSNFWELTAVELDNLIDNSGKTYFVQNNYTFYDKAYTDELAWNNSVLTVQLAQKDWYIETYITNNTVPIVLTQITINNRTDAWEIIDAFQGNATGIWNYWMFNTQNYTNLTHYNKTTNSEITVMDCENVPEVAAALRASEIDYDRISRNSVKVVTDELEYFSDKIVEDLKTEEDSGWSDKDYIFGFGILVLIFIGGLNLKKTTTEFSIPDNVIKDIEKVSKVFDNVEVFTEDNIESSEKETLSSVKETKVKEEKPIEEFKVEDIKDDENTKSAVEEFTDLIKEKVGRGDKK